MPPSLSLNLLRGNFLEGKSQELSGIWLITADEKKRRGLVLTVLKGCDTLTTNKNAHAVT